MPSPPVRRITDRFHIVWFRGGSWVSGTSLAVVRMWRSWTSFLLAKAFQTARPVLLSMDVPFTGADGNLWMALAKSGECRDIFQQPERKRAELTCQHHHSNRPQKQSRDPLYSVHVTLHPIHEPG